MVGIRSTTSTTLEIEPNVGAGRKADEDRHASDRCIERLAKEVAVFLKSKSVAAEHDEGGSAVESEAAYFSQETFEERVDDLDPGRIPGASPLEVGVVEVDRLVGRARGQNLGHPPIHTLGLAGPFEQRVHLLEGEVGPTGQDEQEVLVGVYFHPLRGFGARLCDRLVRVEALRETVVAATWQALDEGGGGVAGSLEHLGQSLGLVGHVVARRPEPVGGRVETAEEGGQRRLGLRRLGEGPLEAHRLGRQCVKGGCPGRCAVAAESIGPQTIESDDDDRMGACNDAALLGLVSTAGHQHHNRDETNRYGGQDSFQEALLFHYCNTLPGRQSLARRRRRDGASSEF